MGTRVASPLVSDAFSLRAGRSDDCDTLTSENRRLSREADLNLKAAMIHNTLIADTTLSAQQK